MKSAKLLSRKGFESWARELGNGWHLDEPMLANHGTFLLWRSTTQDDGYYIEIEKQEGGSGMVRCGEYEGAWEHITDAVFKCIGRRRFTTMTEALGAVRETTGWSGAVNLCHAGLRDAAPWRTD